MKKCFPSLTLAVLFGVLFNPLLLSQEKQKEFTLYDIFKSREFHPKMVHGLTPMNDGKTYSVLENDSINIYDYKKGAFQGTILTRDELMAEGDTAPIPLHRYSFNHKETMVLIPTLTETIYRHSTRSEFYLFNLKTKALNRLSDQGKQRLADFSPDDSKMAFIRNNNIFIKNLETGKEYRITDDGEDRRIINGTTDWVYEEEFGFTKAFFWSPDGGEIAYYKFDERHVPEYWLQIWGDLYPENIKYKYPKAGKDNSLVSIHIYDVESGKTRDMDIGDETDQYIPRIKWTKSAELLAIQRMNRLQNKLEILLANAETGESGIIYTEDNPYYIDITDSWTFLDDNTHFLITSEMNGYNHIYLYNLEGKLIRQLTNGTWDVINVIGTDEKKNLVYYISAESSPLNRDIYAVDLNGAKTKISQREGTNHPKFSTTYNYFINTYTNANTPPYITVNKSNGKEVRVLENNRELIEKTREYGFSEKTFFHFTTPENTKLNGWKILPWNFNPNKKYPVLIYVYGGPGSQTVTNSWGYTRDLWFQLLAKHGMMVVSVDNRGTGARGQEFKKMTYMQLGKYETIDQIEAAKYVASLDHTDPDHIGIFGWSYGGYMSTLAMTRGTEYFSAGIAVAPVTNWRYYDNIYTERFMRTPRENPTGYDDNAPINHVDKLEGPYLLIHGTADDNVHLQNTMDLVTALVEANKQFELQLYPNKNHGIFGGNTTFHLYTKMTDFLLKNLKK